MNWFPSFDKSTEPIIKFEVYKTIGQPMTLHFKDISQNNSVVKWSWDFGDGQSQTTVSREVDHTYKKDGSYVVQMKITDLSNKVKVATSSAIKIPTQIISLQEQLQEYLPTGGYSSSLPTGSYSSRLPEELHHYIPQKVNSKSLSEYVPQELSVEEIIKDLTCDSTCKRKEKFTVGSYQRNSLIILIIVILILLFLIYFYRDRITAYRF
jgi:hypothetical protein